MSSLGTILVAEDDEAADGVEAMAHVTASSSAIVLVILDLAMPRMSGWTFREHQLADAEYALMRFVHAYASPPRK